MSSSSRDSTPRKILIIAGEASGDRQASLLMQEIHRLRPQWSFFGLGGERMVAQGLERYFDITQMAVIGFVGVLRRLPFFRRVFKQMIELMNKSRPDAVILVDYPGFNLRFACRAKQHGTPVWYYIAPQVWAWAEGRIKKLRRCVDQLVVVFPFEEEYFRKHRVPVTRVGHPLLDSIKPGVPAEKFRAGLGLSKTDRLLVLMPGSRSGELVRHLPLMLAAVKKLAESGVVVRPMITRAPEISRDQIDNLIEQAEMIDVMVTDDVHSAIAAADLALVKSGTATVECAILGTPLVVVYQTGWINYAIARRLIKTKYIAMVNLIAGRAIVPELIQKAAQPEKLAARLADLLNDQVGRETMLQDLAEVREKLGPPGGAQQAASHFVEWLEQRAAGN